MNVRVNGETRQLQEPCTLAQLIETLGLADKRIAVEVNHEIIPRSRYATHLLAEGDKIEVVHAIGGGAH